MHVRPLKEQAWPLAGREDELAEIEAARGDPAAVGVILTGAAGVGKTRLAQAALDQAAAAGHEIRWVVATRSAASIPFGAVSHLLPAGEPFGGTPLAVLRRIADDIGTRSARRPVVVGVDDAHLLDDASATLIHLLATQALAFLVVTVRGREPAPDAITALAKEDRVRPLPVRALAAPAVDELIDCELNGPVDGITRLEVRRLAEGNPLLLRELLREGVATGALSPREGLWRWRGGLHDSVPLADLVATRLSGVPAEARAVCEVVACGEPLPVTLLEQLTEPAALDAAIRGGLLGIERSGRRSLARLAHPLYGEVIRATLPVGRAREVWGSLATALMRTPMRRRDDVLLAGVWQVQSGAVGRPDVLLPAARQAFARFDLDLAERLARAARGGTDTGEVERMLAEILKLRGRYEEAAAVLPQRDDTAQGAATRAAILYWGLDQAGEAERVLDAADGDQAEAARSLILLFEGRCRESVAAGSRVLAAAGGRDDVVLRAAAGVTAAAALLGRFEEAMAARGRALAILGRAPREELAWEAEQVGFASCLALLAAGRMEEAWRTADGGYREAVAQRASTTAGCWLALRGVTEKTRGAAVTACASLREAVALLGDEDPYQIRRACLAKLAGATALIGDAGPAAEWLARADAEHRAANKLFTAWVEQDRAWVLAAGGRLTEAVAQARRAASLARQSDQPAHEVMALYDTARLGGAQSVRDRLDELAGEIEGALAPALAVAAGALHAGDGSALDRVATTFHDLGLTLLTAEALAAAVHAYRSAGLPARAASARQRAALLAGACEGARTPLLNLDELGEPLTPREREVVLLAASGQPSREIADRLRLSTRTVDNYLGRAYGKLGVTGRHELAALFTTSR